MPHRQHHAGPLSRRGMIHAPCRRHSLPPPLRRGAGRNVAPFADGPGTCLPGCASRVMPRVPSDDRNHSNGHRTALSISAVAHMYTFTLTLARSRTLLSASRTRSQRGHILARACARAHTHTYARARAGWTTWRGGSACPPPMARPRSPSTSPRSRPLPAPPIPPARYALASAVWGVRRDGGRGGVVMGS